MLKCLECECVFTEDELRHEHIPGTRYEPPEDDFIAPCGHEDFETAWKCQYCGEWYRDDESSEAEGMCQYCFAGGAKEILRLVEAHGSNTATAVYSFLRGA